MKPSLIKRLSLSLFAALMFASTLCTGTTLLSLDLNALSLRADHIVVGRVMDSASFLKDGRVYTLHRVEVTTAIFSDQKEHDVLEVVTEGGHTATLTQQVDGAALLEVGAEYLLFLDSRGDFGTLYVTGMSQGAYLVLSDDSSTAKFVHPPNRLPSLVSRDAVTTRLRGGEFWMKQKTRLDSLAEEIRAVIRGRK